MAMAGVAILEQSLVVKKYCSRTICSTNNTIEAAPWGEKPNAIAIIKAITTYQIELQHLKNKLEGLAIRGTKSLSLHQFLKY